MRKLLFLAFFAILTSAADAAPVTHVVTSPDGRVKMVFTLADRVSYTVLCDGLPLISDCRMELVGPDGALVPADGFIRAFNFEADEVIHPVVPLKFSEINNRYNGSFGMAGSKQEPMTRELHTVSPFRPPGSGLLPMNFSDSRCPLAVVLPCN